MSVDAFGELATEETGDQAHYALRTAQAMARAGYYLTPVTLRRRPDGKKGATFHATGGWRHEGAWSRDPDVIRAWWVDFPDTSFAISCRLSGCEATDHDVKGDADGVQLWAEAGLPWGGMLVETPSGGLHSLWSADPARHLPDSANAGIVPGVDTRSIGREGESWGGILYAPGSYIVGEPGAYRIQGPLVPAAELPRTPVEVLDAFPPPAPKLYRADGAIVAKDRAVMALKCKEAVDALAALPPRTGGSVFRGMQMGAAMMLGRFCEADGTPGARWALDALEAATVTVWGSVSADDALNIESGLADGPRKERWRWRAAADVPTTAPAVPADVTDRHALGTPIGPSVQVSPATAVSVQESGSTQSDLSWSAPASTPTDQGVQVGPGSPLDGSPLDVPSSWRRIELADDWDDDSGPPQPTILAREDGACLFYPGATHSLYGESESGKSWLAQLAVLDEIRAGNDVLYLDYESDQHSIRRRFKTLGMTKDEAAHLDYRRPNGPRDAEWVALLERRYSLAVVDGVTAALVVDGLSSLDNDEITSWYLRLPGVLAEQTGAAVVTIDHVPKGSGGRFAIGGQAKLSTLTGAGYRVEPEIVPRRGHVGYLRVYVTKDRPGGVREHSGVADSERAAPYARVKIDSTLPGVMACRVLTWTGDEGEDTFDRGTGLDLSWSSLDAWPLPADVLNIPSGRGATAAMHLALYMRAYADDPTAPGVRRTEAVKALQQLPDGRGGTLYRDDSVLRHAWALLIKQGRLIAVTGNRVAEAHWCAKPGDPGPAAAGSASAPVGLIAGT